MSFPDLVVESVIRDGLENIKNDLTIIDDIFEELTKVYAVRKYGTSELAKIKQYFTEKGKSIAVTHSFSDGMAKSPSFSIQLGSDTEASREDILDDFFEDRRVLLSPSELDTLIKADNIPVVSYDSTTGELDLTGTDLSNVYPAYLFEDASGAEFEIQSVTDNSIFISQGATPDLSDVCKIKSFLKEKQFEVRSVETDVKIMIGVHSQDALLTKYLYVILKYILMSRKSDMIKRCLDRITFQGSDFTRDLQFQGDHVYTRFLTLSGRMQDVWSSDKVDLIDSVEIEAEPIDC